MGQEFDQIDGIKIRALRAVWKPDQDAILRRIFRWYSERYHTPLHTVEDLPLEDVLQTWFEVQYEDMAPEDRHNLAIYLLEDDEDRRQRESENRRSDDEFYLMSKSKMKRDVASRKLRDRVAEAKSKLDKIGKQLDDSFKPVGDKPMKDLELYQPPVQTKTMAPEEEIVISHVDGNLWDDDEGGIVPPPRRK